MWIDFVRREATSILLCLTSFTCCLETGNWLVEVCLPCHRCEDHQDAHLPSLPDWIKTTASAMYNRSSNHRRCFQTWYLVSTSINSSRPSFTLHTTTAISLIITGAAYHHSAVGHFCGSHWSPPWPIEFHKLIDEFLDSWRPSFFHCSGKGPLFLSSNGSALSLECRSTPSASEGTGIFPTPRNSLVSCLALGIVRWISPIPIRGWNLRAQPHPHEYWESYTRESLCHHLLAKFLPPF